MKKNVKNVSSKQNVLVEILASGRKGYQQQQSLENQAVSTDQLRAFGQIKLSRPGQMGPTDVILAVNRMNAEGPVASEEVH